MPAPWIEVGLCEMRLHNVILLSSITEVWGSKRKLINDRIALEPLPSIGEWIDGFFGKTGEYLKIDG
jgi:hypothetical protein